MCAESGLCVENRRLQREAEIYIGNYNFQSYSVFGPLWSLMYPTN